MPEKDRTCNLKAKAMKRTLTVSYCCLDTEEEHAISKEFDIEDYALSDVEISLLKDEVISLIPDESNAFSYDITWDNEPAPKGSGANPPENAWFDFGGRAWATDGIMIIAQDQPIRIPALERWREASLIIRSNLIDVFAGCAGAASTHKGFFDISFKPFDAPMYKTMTADNIFSPGYVFEVSSNRLIAIVMPVKAKGTDKYASFFKFANN